MVNATIKPVQHPLCQRRIGEKIPRLKDQIVKIKPAPLQFLRLIALDKTLGKRAKRDGFLGDIQTQPVFARSFDAAHPIINLCHITGQRPDL